MFQVYEHAVLELRVMDGLSASFNPTAASSSVPFNAEEALIDDGSVAPAASQGLSQGTTDRMRDLAGAATPLSLRGAAARAVPAAPTSRRLKKAYYDALSVSLSDPAADADDDAAEGKAQYLYLVHNQHMNVAKIGVTSLTKEALVRRYESNLGRVDAVELYLISNGTAHIAYFLFTTFSHVCFICFAGLVRTFLEKLFLRLFQHVRLYRRREFLYAERDGTNYIEVYARHLYYLASTPFPSIYKDIYCKVRSKTAREEWIEQRVAEAIVRHSDAAYSSPAAVSHSSDDATSDAEESGSEEIEAGELGEGDGYAGRTDHEDSGKMRSAFYCCFLCAYYSKIKLLLQLRQGVRWSWNTKFSHVRRLRRRKEVARPGGEAPPRQQGALVCITAVQVLPAGGLRVPIYLLQTLTGVASRSPANGKCSYYGLSYHNCVHITLSIIQRGAARRHRLRRRLRRRLGRVQ